MIRNLIVLYGLLCTLPVFAQPSAAIVNMMQTPASVFDLFLLRVYEASKCNTVLKNENADEADLCLSTISYDSGENILSAFFRVLPGAEAMDDFVEQEMEGRRAILLKLLETTARRVGALDTWGLLHSTPLGYGRNASVADEKAFRAELAQRTTTSLSTSYDGVVYIATRHYDGTIEYFTNP